MINDSPVSLRDAIHRVLLAAAAGLTVAAPIVAPAAELPQACAAGNCGITGPSAWVTSGNATALYSGNTLNIQQTTERAILNWSSFNVSADGQVNFNQPGRSSIALNRIYQDSPSRIFGQVNANGEIYLVNPNGIVFGRTAKVNAAGILASTLDISDTTFATGIAAGSLLQNGVPALDAVHSKNFANRMSVLDADGNPVHGHIDANGNLVVDPLGDPIEVQLLVQQGAQLQTSGANGRILLAAQNVDNSGSIAANDGQAILAAGDAVFLRAGSDPTLRGLTVEVAAGGSVWNRLAGQISTPRGNTTLVGFAVNQDGRISATTSVAANGSIRLLARDNAAVTFGNNGPELEAKRTGTLEFGSQSVTSIVPELQDTATAVDDQTQNPSHIEAMGHQVTLRGGSVLRANGGRIDVSAVLDPSGRTLDATDIQGGKVAKPEETVANVDGQSQLRIESGAVVDVSGSDATLPMSRNLITVELRGSELADSPNQRDSAIRGRPVVVDARTGTILADVQGAIAAVPKSVAERTSRGGEAVFVSDGDVVANAGSSFDVSGGALHYEQGMIATSQLIGADGKVYDIASADPARTYVGLINPVYRRVDDRWGQIELINAPGLGRMEPGYVQGSAAGTLQFVAPTMVLNGTFTGNAIAGPYQRSAGRVPSGGRFILGLDGGVTSVPPLVDYRAPSVQFNNAAPPLVIADGAALPGGAILQLPTDFLSNGFTRTEIYSNGSVTLPQDLALPLSAGSTFKATGTSVNIFSDITSAGGSIALTSHDPFFAASARQPGIFLGAGVVLDVRGLWINDSLLDPNIRPVNPLLQNGGSISLVLAGLGATPGGGSVPAMLQLGDDVQLRASGGAAVSRSGAITAGRGGSITLQTNGFNSEVEVGANVGMDAFGVLGAQGGSFSFTAPTIEVGNGSSWSGEQSYDPTADAAFFQIGTALFTDYGFSTVKLAAARPRQSEDDADILRVVSGTDLNAQVSSLQLSADANTRPSDATVADFSSVVLPPANQRVAADVSFAAGLSSAAVASRTDEAGDLSVAAGALIHGDTGSRFSFASLGSLFIDGTVRAPGGAINAGVGTPSSDKDGGFLEGQRLQVGSTAVLDVSGTAVFTPNDAFLLGSVVGGGSINLASDRGSVLVASGAHLDVSGGSAQLDVATGDATHPYDRRTVGSSGGSLLVRAPESIGLYGEIDARAGAADIGQAAAGSLSMQLTRNAGFAPNTTLPTFPTGPRRIEVSVGEVGGSAAPENGVARISEDFIRRSGVDALTLRADDEIAIRSGVDLAFGRQLSLDTPMLTLLGNGAVNLAAAYVSIGSSLPSTTSATPVAGAATLDVRADFIDVIGSSVINSVAQATLHSDGDIRLRGTTREIAAQKPVIGNLNIAGDLLLEASRIYGATGTQFTVQAAGGLNNRIEIQQTGASQGTPLSAGTSLRLVAQDIVQGGTLLAPFGSISLEGAHSVELRDGSTTSVSAAGTVIPYGRVAIGDWKYVNAGVEAPIDGVPTRQVSIASDSVTIAPDATVDIRGGGDLYAYEWVPGTGGSRDALAPGVTPGLYAVLPSLQGQYAPYDPQEYTGSDLTPGASIYLSGLGDLPAGVYPLLPARYALLPGAYLVSAVAGTTGIVPGSVASLRDGTRVIAGYTTFGNTQLGNTQYSGFAIRPGSYGRALAAYDDFHASSFFADRAERLESGRVTLPADAASLSLFAGTQLDARGDVLTKAASGGRDAVIDVSALRLEITAGAADPNSDGVQLSASQLSQWNPGTLILGGHRVAGSTDGFAVTADEVAIGSGVNLAFDQIVLAAHDEVSIEQGATIASRSGTQGGAAAHLDADAQTLKLSGSADAGATIVAVSDLAQVVVERSGVAAERGAVNLATGATLASRGAITVDAPSGGAFTGDIRADGARVSVGADHMIFGSAGVGDALVIDAALQSRLQNATALQLHVDTLEFARDVSIDLSANSASEIELRAGELRAAADNLSTEFAAHRVTLSGGAAKSSSDAEPTAGSGQFGLTADTLVLGPGSIDVDRYARSSWTARQQVIGEGASHFRVGGDLDVAAPVIALASDGDTAIGVAGEGTARLIGAPAPAGQNPQAALGGSLRVTAGHIEDSTTILAPSGLVDLRSAHELQLQDGATIDVAGRMVAAGGRILGSNGGSIRLAAGEDLSTAATSSLLLSGKGDSSAGRLQVQADGMASLAGSMVAQAEANAPGGSFDLNAGQLSDFGALNATLQSGGFSSAQRVRVAAGDLVLAAGTQTTAQSVDLVADTGAVRVAGTISAPGNDTRGQIRLYGATGVELASGAQLHADAGANGTRGGSIEMGTTTGSVDLAPGSVVSAAGSAGDGALLIRAPVVQSAANPAEDDIAITRLAADLSNLQSIVLAPVFSFDVASDFAGEADFAPVLAAAASFVDTSAASIRERLSPEGSLPIALRPDIELRHTGDLALDPLELSAWRFGGEPGSLTVRASGSLLVNGTISDGFVASGAQFNLAPTASSSITLVAGADLAGSDPTAISRAAATGDLTLGFGAVVRTGTGNISLNAAHNVSFSEGSSVYTGGLPGEAAQIMRPSNALVVFADQGGSISVRAGEDVLGSSVAQSVSTWQFRGNRASTAAPFARFYGSNAAKFGWNLGTLGGGDLSVSAGHDVRDLSAAAADSVSVHTDGSLHQYGGGSLAVSAGNDIDSGLFYGAQGTLRLHADGQAGSDRLTAGVPNPLGNSLALGNARATVEARRDILLERAVNPTLLQTPGLLRESVFFTFGDQSSLRLQSAGGDVYAAQGLDLETNFENTVTTTLAEAFNVYPSSLTVRAYNGDLVLNNSIVLFPASNGQLDLFAAQDIRSGENAGRIVMSDGAAAAVPTVLNPQSTADLALTEVRKSAANSRHLDDPEPAFITAGRDLFGLEFNLAKSARYTAGRDIADLTILGQNLRATDLTLISAGRDFTYSNSTANQTRNISIGGPGRLDVLAGREVNLGFTRGIATTGSINNPSLPTATGADVTVMAGLGEQPDYAAFIAQVIAPSSEYDAKLIDYIKSLTGTTLDRDAALTKLQGLDAAAQRPFIDAVFFNELVLSGREANNTPGAGFKRGYAAIDALFPGSGAVSGDASHSPYRGDISMAFSRIYTLAGGDITLLIPGGQLNVGLANPPSSVSKRDPSELGIVAQGEGDVHIYADQDVLVNSSRVFTLLGGDIAVWSTHGNIDAGRGAKSSLSAPPPTVSIDDTGKVVINFTGAVAGSGIRTIVVADEIKPGDVDLIAPSGFVNAGDAGIGSGGNLNIAAQRVIGLDNIQVGGSATGVPAETGGLGAALSGVTAAASSSSNASSDAVEGDEKKKETAPQLSQAALSWLDVFVVGLGEETCKQDDVECLKRQQ